MDRRDKGKQTGYPDGLSSPAHKHESPPSGYLTESKLQYWNQMQNAHSGETTLDGTGTDTAGLSSSDTGTPASSYESKSNLPDRIKKLPQDNLASSQDSSQSQRTSQESDDGSSLGGSTDSSQTDVIQTAIYDADFYRRLGDAATKFLKGQKRAKFIKQSPDFDCIKSSVKDYLVEESAIVDAMNRSGRYSRMFYPGAANPVVDFVFMQAKKRKDSRKVSYLNLLWSNKKGESPAIRGIKNLTPDAGYFKNEDVVLPISFGDEKFLPPSSFIEADLAQSKFHAILNYMKGFRFKSFTVVVFATSQASTCKLELLLQDPNAKKPMPVTNLTADFKENYDVMSDSNLNEFLVNKGSEWADSIRPFLTRTEITPPDYQTLSEAIGCQVDVIQVEDFIADHRALYEESKSRYESSRLKGDDDLESVASAADFKGGYDEVMLSHSLSIGSPLRGNGSPRKYQINSAPTSPTRDYPAKDEKDETARSGSISTPFALAECSFYSDGDAILASIFGDKFSIVLEFRNMPPTRKEHVMDYYKITDADLGGLFKNLVRQLSVSSAVSQFIQGKISELDTLRRNPQCEASQSLKAAQIKGIELYEIQLSAQKMRVQTADHLHQLLTRCYSMKDVEKVQASCRIFKNYVDQSVAELEKWVPGGLSVTSDTDVLSSSTIFKMSEKLNDNDYYCASSLLDTLWDRGFLDLSNKRSKWLYVCLGGEAATIQDRFESYCDRVRRALGFVTGDCQVMYTTRPFGMKFS